MVATSCLLVVEPSESVRQFLNKKLSEVSHPSDELIFCNNASQAINACRKFQFELIICNLDLVDMEGQELLNRIRKTKKNKNTSICVTSGNQEPSLTNGISQNLNKLIYFDKSDGFESLLRFVNELDYSGEKAKSNIIFISQSQTLASVLSQSTLAQKYNFSHLERSDQIVELLKTQQKVGIDLILAQHTEIDHELFAQFLNSIRNDLEISPQELPIFAILAEATDFDDSKYVQLFSLGINDFIHQPLNIDKLQDKISTLIEVTHQNQLLSR